MTENLRILDEVGTLRAIVNTMRTRELPLYPEYQVRLSDIWRL